MSLTTLTVAVAYRLLWGRKFGRSGVEGHYLRLRGRVVGPGDAGQPVDGRPFDLETADGPVYRVDPRGSQVSHHGGPTKVGDRATVDAVHSSVHVSETLYREPALKPAVAALRVIKGRYWPELRWLSPVITLAGLCALVAAVVGVGKPTPSSHLVCPPGTRAGGDRPPAGNLQWCEKDRGKYAVVGSQDGVKHGPWIAWHDRHHILQVGWFHDGKPHGRWTSWDRKGNKHTETHYRHGRRSGKQIVWQSHYAKLEERHHDKRGHRHGRTTTYYPCGALKAVQHHRHGREHGQQLEWYPDGKLESRLDFQDGKRHGSWRHWNPDGELVEAGTYRSGQRHGEWRAWSKTGTLIRRGDYGNGRRQGRWVFWHDNGHIKATGTYVAGIADGDWRWWYPTRQQLAGKGTYQAHKELDAGLPHGVWIAWERTGAVRCRSRYHNGASRGRCDPHESAVALLSPIEN